MNDASNLQTLIKQISSKQHSFSQEIKPNYDKLSLKYIELQNRFADKTAKYKLVEEQFKNCRYYISNFSANKIAKQSEFIFYRLKYQKELSINEMLKCDLECQQNMHEHYSQFMSHMIDYETKRHLQFDMHMEWLQILFNKAYEIKEENIECIEDIYEDVVDVKQKSETLQTQVLIYLLNIKYSYAFFNRMIEM